MSLPGTNRAREHRRRLRPRTDPRRRPGSVRPADSMPPRRRRSPSALQSRKGWCTTTSGASPTCSWRSSTGCPENTSTAPTSSYAATSPAACVAWWPPSTRGWRRLTPAVPPAVAGGGHARRGARRARRPLSAAGGGDLGDMSGRHQRVIIVSTDWADSVPYCCPRSRRETIYQPPVTHDHSKER